MSAYLTLPFRFLLFWFHDAPFALFGYFLRHNKTLLYALSLPLLIRTFFKPLKNEYRSGLVGFSIGMGIVVKTFLIAFDLIMLGIVLLCEGLFLVGFLLLPLATIYLLFL